jgi:hypothetical protein
MMVSWGGGTGSGGTLDECLAGSVFPTLLIDKDRVHVGIGDGQIVFGGHEIDDIGAFFAV